MARAKKRRNAPQKTRAVAKKRRPARTPRRRTRTIPAASGPPPAPQPPTGHTPLFRAMLAVSLDGYIADKDGGVSWLNPYFSPELDFAGFMKTIGATVMGRVTYDWSVRHGTAGQGGGRTVVLTHRPLENPSAGVEAFDGDVRELAERLRLELAGSGKDIWLIGGGRSIASFQEHALVDRWELGIIPVLLGDGVPMFPPHSRGLDGLRLTKSRTLKNGIVEAWYEPVRDET